MKTIFFIYQLLAGEQFTQDMLGAVLGDALRACAFRRDAGCCGAAPCRRASEFDRVGYQLLLQKSASAESLDVPKTGDLFLVQTREPTLRALAAYRHDLAADGRAHSVEVLQSWLADEALRTVDFWRKWGAPDLPRRFVLRFEEFVTAPRETLEAMLTVAGVAPDDAALARAAQRPAAADHATDVSIKALEENPHFVRPYFAEFMNLLAEEVDYLGYRAWQERKPASGPVTTIYRARRALAAGNCDQALSLLAPFVAVNTVEPEVRAVLGEALLEAGREVEGRRALDGLLKSRPDYFGAYGILARHAYRLGLTVEGRGVLREAMARRGGAQWVRAFLESSKLDHDLLCEFPEHSEPPIGRDAVIAGFTWILGRRPESEAVIEGHRRLHDEDDLRLSLLRSREFHEFHERFEVGQEAAPQDAGGPAIRDDLLEALRWILGRPPRSRDEAVALLNAPSRAALRLRLFGEDEFKQAYAQAAEAV